MKQTGPTLFVMEDTPFYQQLISKVLQPAASEIFYFTTGESLLLKLPFVQPDMVILDYNVDGEMTGLDTLLAIRQRYPDLPAILFSTCTELPSEENFARYGAFGFIEKNAAGLSVLRTKVLQALAAVQ